MIELNSLKEKIVVFVKKNGLENVLDLFISLDLVVRKDGTQDVEHGVGLYGYTDVVSGRWYSKENARIKDLNWLRRELGERVWSWQGWNVDKVVDQIVSLLEVNGLILRTGCGIYGFYDAVEKQKNDKKEEE